MVISYIAAFAVCCMSFYDLYTVLRNTTCKKHLSRRRMTLSIQPLAVQGLLIACKISDEDSCTVAIVWAAVTTLLAISIWWNLSTNSFVRIQLAHLLFALVVLVSAPYMPRYAEVEASTLGAVGVLFVYVITRRTAGRPPKIHRQPPRVLQQHRNRSNVSRNRSNVSRSTSNSVSRTKTRIINQPVLPA